MSQPTDVYEGIIERGSGAIRLAQLPAEAEYAPVQFGVRRPRRHRQALPLGPGRD
jgi:hypothetical protein